MQIEKFSYFLFNFASHFNFTKIQMAYTLGPNVMNMRGNYWMQEAKEVIIQYMPERIAFALRSFARHNQGSFPLHLVRAFWTIAFSDNVKFIFFCFLQIVYRGGISEGNFSKVFLCVVMLTRINCTKECTKEF